MASKPFSSGHILAAADVNDLVGVLDRSTSEVDAVSTTSMEVYSKVIPAGAMSTDRVLRVTCLADYLNDSGSSRTSSVLLILGGTTIAECGAGVAADATRKIASFTVDIANRASASSQINSAWVADYSTSNRVVMTIGTTAINTAVAQTLTIHVLHSASHASLSWRKRYVLVELL